jgi:hypothetical protein
VSFRVDELQPTEKLIAHALAGTPPSDIESDIEEELKDFFMPINDSC